MQDLHELGKRVTAFRAPIFVRRQISRDDAVAHLHLAFIPT